MEYSKARRLKVFRSITGDNSPPFSDYSSSIHLDQTFSHFSDANSFIQTSDLSATLNSSLSSTISEPTQPQTPIFQPQVASRMLKNQVLQNLQHKIIDPKHPFSRPSPSLRPQFESQDLIQGNLSNRSCLNLSTEDSSREEIQERGKPKKRPLYENEKNLYVIRLDIINSGKDTRTTVMIKNIPNKYSQKMLLHAIDKRFVGTYDFLYLPIDFKNRCNVGYAFINFWDFRVIVQFFLEFDGKRWERFNSEKVCAIAYARIQGFKELVQHFENSSVINQDDNKVKPVILRRN